MTSVLAMMLVLAQQAPLTLEDCIREALARHPDVSLAQRDIERARAQELGTRAGYLPRLDLSMQAGYNFFGERDYSTLQGGERIPNTAPAGHNANHGFSLRLSQNLLDGGKWWTEVSRAEREVERSRAGVAVTRESVAAQVIAAYYELIKARQQRKVLEATLDLSEAQLHLAKERLRLGAASKVDVSKAAVSVGEDRIAVERQAGVIETATVDLAYAIGLEIDPGFLVADPPAVAIGATPAGPAPAAGHSRLRELQLAYQVAAIDVDVAKADRWPVLMAGAAFSRQDPDFVTVYSKFDKIYTLGLYLSLSFPIFDGFLTASRIEQASVAVGQIQDQIRSAQQDLAAQLARARNDLQRLGTISAIEEENVLAAEQQLELARESYAIGKGTALELRDAQRAVTQAKLLLVQTQFDHRIALARYHYAQGDLLPTYLPGGQQP